MAKKDKAPAGTKAKAKAVAKEETKKEKVLKTAKKGKHHTSRISLSILQFSHLLICDRVFNVSFYVWKHT